MYCPYGNTVNFSHASNTFLGEQYAHSNEWEIQMNGGTNGEKSQEQSFI